MTKKEAPLSASNFPDFFHELWDYDPFPWQKRLADRVCEGDWPACIALPTASGKTACIDIAVFALACQASRPAAERTAPRRIFFVVDRRVVVDQAYERAKDLSRKLAELKTEIARRVADALRHLSGDDRPLDCYALRGGMYRETAWVRSPLQPIVITSTVDQVGSRLLFHGYGVSDSLKPMHAGLIGNDSLILLDEAHCSRPFEQTVKAVGEFRKWRQRDDESLPPFRFVTMTATPSPGVPDDQIERDNADDRNDRVLGKRIKASKPTRLVVARKASGKEWRKHLVDELSRQTRELVDEGFRAVGVIVNRVATARETARKMEEGLKKDSKVILLTGRMRPVDRDEIMSELAPLLTGNPDKISEPLVVVATQCLEVGADLDFHALVTECASLDALRQRFGRLNRRADRTEAKAVVVIRKDQIKPAKKESESDPVYGNSLAHTWEWLEKNASDGMFDFGTAAVNAKTSDLDADKFASLNAPSVDAAVLLPAYLDCWVQTSPIPTPDPDPAVFLHGPSRGVPNVQVVLRGDLGLNDKAWGEIVSLCPPSSSEALPVRIDVFNRWLSGVDATDDTSDVEGERSDNEEQPKDANHRSDRKALRWRGSDSDQTKVIREPGQVFANDVYILSTIADGLTDLGGFLGKIPADHAEEAYQISRDRAILRLTPEIWKIPTLDDVDMETDGLDEILSDAIGALVNDPSEWIRTAAANLEKAERRSVKSHPSGGFVVIGRNRLGRFDPTGAKVVKPRASSLRGPVTLGKHSDDVARCAERFATECGLKSADAFKLAGLLHDIGKADPRFQAWLHGGNRRKAEWREPLAKSINPPRSRDESSRFREHAGYPKGGRHELLSVRLAECNGVLPADPDARDLILHLIASHHGRCRPFAPVVQDAMPEEVRYQLNESTTLATSTATGLERLDSGVAERFWKLVRRHGWWGLAYLEAILRLADWQASEAETHSATDTNKEGKP